MKLAFTDLTDNFGETFFDKPFCKHVGFFGRRVNKFACEISLRIYWLEKTRSNYCYELYVVKYQETDLSCFDIFGRFY